MRGGARVEGWQAGRQTGCGRRGSEGEGPEIGAGGGGRGAEPTLHFGVKTTEMQDSLPAAVVTRYRPCRPMPSSSVV